ncbi:MAG: HEAT repeat domain-containing protein [Mastigocoleus sp. MO_167.B18]|nr:HEAT repeat domain-containing protein [Mastigocoleus sp. MO_167.B18]
MDPNLEEEVLNPNTSASRLRELSKSLDREVRQAIVKNPNTPPDVLVRLFDKFPLQVLHNPALSLILLERPNFLTEIYESNKLVFHKYQLTDFFYNWAIFHVNESIRSAVASSSKTPEHYLEQLSDDKNSFVRLQVAANYNSSARTLKKLALDRDNSVRKAVARNPNVPINILEKLARDETAEVRREVAANHNTPFNILAKLAQDPSLIVRASCYEE